VERTGTAAGADAAGAANEDEQALPRSRPAARATAGRRLGMDGSLCAEVGAGGLWGAGVVSPLRIVEEV
jgi:hypothetical protein